MTDSMGNYDWPVIATTFRSWIKNNKYEASAK